jgi:hypothetical protein
MCVIETLNSEDLWMLLTPYLFLHETRRVVGSSVLETVRKFVIFPKTTCLSLILRFISKSPLIIALRDGRRK